MYAKQNETQELILECDFCKMTKNTKRGGDVPKVKSTPDKCRVVVIEGNWLRKPGML